MQIGIVGVAFAHTITTESHSESQRVQKHSKKVPRTPPSTKADIFPSFEVSPSLGLAGDGAGALSGHGCFRYLNYGS